MRILVRLVLNWKFLEIISQDFVAPYLQSAVIDMIDDTIHDGYSDEIQQNQPSQHDIEMTER